MNDATLYSKVVFADLAPLNATFVWYPDGRFSPAVVNSDCAPFWTGDYRYADGREAFGHAERELRSIIRRATR